MTFSIILSSWIGAIHSTYSVTTNCATYQSSDLYIVMDSNTSNSTTSVITQKANVSMALYTDMALTNPLPIPSSVSVGTSLYIKVVLLNPNSATDRIYISDCTAYKSATDTSKSLALISNMCPVGFTVNLIKSTENNVAVFGFDAFSFAGSSGMYLNCKVSICASDDSSAVCTQSCSSQQHLKSVSLSRRRRRRDTTSGSTGSLTQFQILVKSPLSDSTIICSGNCTITVGSDIYQVINGLLIFLIGHVSTLMSSIAITASASTMSTSSTAVPNGGLSLFVIISVVLAIVVAVLLIGGAIALTLILCRRFKKKANNKEKEAMSASTDFQEESSGQSDE